MAEHDNDLGFLIDLARGRFSRRDMLKASGALTAGAAIGGGLAISKLADVFAPEVAAPARAMMARLSAIERSVKTCG